MAFEKCVICGNGTKDRCSGCKAVTYCSKECQLLDRPLHKILCSKYYSFLETRPASIPPATEPKKYVPRTHKDVDEGDDSDSFTDFESDDRTSFKLAILFPVDSKRPKLIWLQCKEYVDHPSEAAHHLVEESLETYLHDVSDRAQIARFGREIDIYVGMDSIGSEPPNVSICWLNEGYETVDRSQTSIFPAIAAGNLAVTSVRRVKDNHGGIVTFYNDVNLADLRHSLQYLTQHNNIFESENENPYVIREKNEWTKAVIISCSGDIHYSNKSKYRQVSIHRSHEVYAKNPALRSPVSYRMDIPLLVKKLNFSPAWSHHINTGVHIDICENSAANFLMIKADTQGYDWHCPVDGWDTGLDPPVLVALSDFKDITTTQVEGLVGFMKRVYNVMWNEMMTTYWRKRFCVRHFQSKNFERYMDKLKAEKVKDGEAAWADVAPLRGDWTGKYGMVFDDTYDDYPGDYGEDEENDEASDQDEEDSVDSGSEHGENGKAVHEEHLKTNK